MISYLLKTAVIVVVVWGIALLQLPMVNAKTRALTNLELTATQSKVEQAKPEIKPQTTKLTSVELVGISKRIALKNIDKLWLTFEEDRLLQGRLTKNPSEVYVWYRNFDKNYEIADVSIGYASSDISLANDAMQVTVGDYQTLLKSGQYSKQELAQGWRNIDYRKSLLSVVETHNLDANSATLSSQLTVLYK